MSKAAKTSITAIYQASEAERYIVTVEIANDYPDALATARAEAVRGVHELLADAIAQAGVGTQDDE